MGTLIAWVLVRDEFRGKRFVNALIDLPFALPTIVAGLTLLALYGRRAVGESRSRKWAVLLALLFVTLPFVVRAVQPVLHRARPRDGGGGGVARRVAADDLPPRSSCPNLVPAIISGVRARVRPRGRRVRLDRAASRGNIPFDTQVASVYAYKQIESDNIGGAAAVSVVLLLLSLLVLLGSAPLERWGTRHDG